MKSVTWVPKITKSTFAERKWNPERLPQPSRKTNLFSAETFTLFPFLWISEKYNVTSYVRQNGSQCLHLGRHLSQNMRSNWISQDLWKEEWREVRVWFHVKVKPGIIDFLNFCVKPGLKVNLGSCVFILTLLHVAQAYFHVSLSTGW